MRNDDSSAAIVYKLVPTGLCGKKLKLSDTRRLNYALKISKYAQKLCANSNKK